MAEERAGPRRGHILVKGTKTGLPYSKGLLASSIQATGLDAGVAYQVAEAVEEALEATGTGLVTVGELREVTADVLAREVSEAAAERYRRWQAAQERELPLLVLIGGPTGAGKSTVATQVAQRLGIVRIIATDAVREVMRATVSRELLPSLHVSSFETADAIGVAPQHSRDHLLLDGFLRQTQAVAVGVEHVMERAVEERTDTILEGVHLVPGATTVPASTEAITVQVLLTVGDFERHRSHLSGRSQDQPQRGQQRYLDHFPEIRRIQEELIRRAEAVGVPTIPSYALDQTVEEITALVVDAVTGRRFQGTGPLGGTHPPDQAPRSA